MLKVFFVYKNDENNNLDTFEMVVSTNELANELVNKKTTNILKISSGCESIKCPWSAQGNVNPYSQLLVF
jgi:hypothetical protein